MLKLKSLSLEGVGRFVDPQTIDFSQLGNLVQVDGENRNTSGSSGSGKSTIFNALDYLLGLNDLPTTVLQSRLTKEPMEASGDFDYDGLPLSIRRSKKGLRIDLNGEITEGSSALAEEKLDRILGMPRGLFRKILHKRQKEGGFFLDFTPKQMHEFLTDCLGLSDIRKKTEIIENRLKVLDAYKAGNISGFAASQYALKATQDAILALGLAPIKDIHQTVILELKEKYEKAKRTFEEVSQRHQLQDKELAQNRPNTHVLQFDGTVRDDLDKRKREIEASIQENEREERQRHQEIRNNIHVKSLERSQNVHKVGEYRQASTRATEIAGQVKKIRASLCPTCDQSWVTEAAKNQEAELIKKLSECKTKILEGVAAEQKIVEIDSEVAALQKELLPRENFPLQALNFELARIFSDLSKEKEKELKHNGEQNAKNKSLLDTFAAQQVALRNLHTQEMDQVRGQLDVDRRAFESSIMKLKSYEDARIRYETSMKSFQESEARYLNESSRLAADHQKIVEELEIVEELKKAMKSFISYSFDDALESIGDAATKIIRCIPNMSNATIQFEGTKETKEGKVKEEVTAVISADGEIGIPIKSLSGGERSSVDLAVDLAVIDFIESKTGKGIDVFILDEPFTGLDTVSIEMALEVLKNSNSNKRLIIVDHNPEVKQMVASRLVVVRDGVTSTITQE